MKKKSGVLRLFLYMLILMFSLHGKQRFHPIGVEKRIMSCPVDKYSDMEPK